MRSRVVGDAVREDGRDLVLAADYLAAWDALRVPTVLLRAPRGMLGQAPGLLSEDAVAEAARRRPDITIEPVADANHYTIVLADRFAAQVARHIEAASGRPGRALVRLNRYLCLLGTAYVSPAALPNATIAAMTAVTHWPAVIEPNPVSAPPRAVATEDRNARSALSPAATHALVAVVLVVIGPASPDCTVVVVIGRTPLRSFRIVACHARQPGGGAVPGGHTEESGRLVTVIPPPGIARHAWFTGPTQRLATCRARRWT